MRRWMWGLAFVLVIVIAGAILSLTGMGGGEKGKASPNVQVEEPSPREKELQEIKIAASESKLEEARRLEEGWVVRVTQEAAQMKPDDLFEQARSFFQELARTDVEIAETSLQLVTNSLKDVWGNTLKEVPVLRVSFDGDTFRRVNWDGFEPRNLTRVADDIWLHDLVKQEMAKERQQQQQGGGGQGGMQGGQQGNGQGGGGS